MGNDLLYRAVLRLGTPTQARVVKDEQLHQGNRQRSAGAVPWFTGGFDAPDVRDARELLARAK